MPPKPYGTAEGAFSSTTPPPAVCAVCGQAAEQRLCLAIAGVLAMWTELCPQHSRYFAAGGWSLSVETVS